MDFAISFQEALEGVRNCAQTEVKRLKDDNQRLREENLRLTQLLAQAKLGQNVELAPQPEAEPITEISPQTLTAAAAAMNADNSTPPKVTIRDCDASGAPSGGGTSATLDEDDGRVSRKLDDDAMVIKSILKTKSAKIEAYDTSQMYYNTGIFQKIARSSAFEYSTMSVVVLNGIWIAVDVDLNSGDGTNKIWVVMDNLFCAYFSWELFIRFGAFAKKYRVLCDGWFMFDLALVSMMVAETWVMPLINLITGTESSGGGNAGILRLLRLLRLSRMAKMMRSVPELMILIKGTVVGIRSVAITLVLLGGITFVFAIALRTLTDGTEVGAENFTSVPASAYTLIIQGVIPDNGDLMTALGMTEWYYGMLFFLFIFLAALTFMNMLIGILCDAVHGVSCSEKEEMHIGKMTETLKICLEQQEEFIHTTMVTKSMFVEVMKDPECQHLWECFEKLDVDIPSLSDNISGIFEIVDGGAMEFDDFVEVILKFRATDQSVIKGIFDLRSLVHEQFSAIQKRLDNVNKQYRRMSSGALPASFNQPSVDRSPSSTHVNQSSEAVMMELQKLENMLQPVSEALKESVQSVRHLPLKGFEAVSPEAVVANTMQGQSARSANASLPPQATPANTMPPPQGSTGYSEQPISGISQFPPQELTGKTRLDPEVVPLLEFTGEQTGQGSNKSELANSTIPAGFQNPTEVGQDNTLSEHVCFYPFFEENVIQLEFRVSWDGEQPKVLSVRPGGEGERKGIWADDVLVEMNGMITLGKTRDDLLPILAQRPLLLKVERIHERTPV